MTTQLNKESFKEKIFEYETNKEWKFEGKRPTIAAFKTLWCGPCKMVAPILETLSDEYKDKLDIYIIDVDEEKELGAAFGIQSVPTILFIPIDEQPQMIKGGLTKKQFESVITEVLKID